MELEGFRELGLGEESIKALREKGFEEPTEIQRRAIPLLLKEGTEIVGQAQTGTGKTAAFALPILETVSQNGKVQAAFDLLGIRYTGTGYLSSALAMDKGLTKTLFETGGVPTPRGTVHTKAQGICTPKDLGMELPLVVKTCCGGSSVGVYIANTEEEFTSALEQAFAYEEEAVIEEYIKGREFSVAVVDGKAYPVIEIAPLHGFYDYKNKYQPGATVETCPAELSEELTQKMQHYAEL